jgi:hypothetical protein
MRQFTITVTALAVFGDRWLQPSRMHGQHTVRFGTRARAASGAAGANQAGDRSTL